MKTYAMVIDGAVRSHFATDRPITDFPDIQHLLVEAPTGVQDGMLYDGTNFTVPPVVPPTQVELDKQDLRDHLANIPAADAGLPGWTRTLAGLLKKVL